MNWLTQLIKSFESRIRLGVMSILMVNEWVDFNTLKEMLQVTDGNLASHLKALENHKLIKVRKQFIGRKPRTTYQATEKGKNSFRQHLEALENIIKNQTK